MAGGATLLLDVVEWDLTLDANSNMAVAQPPYALAQDASSAIKLFLGEYYFDLTQGVPYLTQIFGKAPANLPLIKQAFINAAISVPGVASASAFITSITGRNLQGQVQVIPQGTITVASQNFSVTNVQGV